mgnify:CR=1 FL=1
MIFSNIVDSLGLEYGDKTQEILNTVKYQEKKRRNYISVFDESLLSKMEEIV